MISIVTSVYNGEKFIESCIKNVIEQQCLNLEHVIIDGNSTDNTVEIIKKYADQYQHIQWISEKDKGQSDAMNKGIAMAKGEILSFLNVDDYYSTNVLNRIVEVFKSLPEPSLLVGNCNVLNDKEEIIQVSKPNKLSLFDLLTARYINYEIYLPLNPTSYFYHASLHKSIGLYNVDEHYVMDIDFILRAVQVATVSYKDEDFGNYRCIPNSKTFEDTLSGQSYSRNVRLLKYYRKDLSFPQQIKILFLELLAKLRYILWSLNKRGSTN